MCSYKITSVYVSMHQIKRATSIKLRNSDLCQIVNNPTQFTVLSMNTEQKPDVYFYQNVYSNDWTVWSSLTICSHSLSTLCQKASSGPTETHREKRRKSGFVNSVDWWNSLSSFYVGLSLSFMCRLNVSSSGDMKAGNR